ncbi:MAG TPA: DUF1778 domain-containing protein [Thermomicrobiales bacterium]|nr:DUF1778 domain-containing protein [Thermomicrobiales bacterium]
MTMTERRGKPTKPARLAARLSPQQKALIERAAAVEGLTVTEFVVRSAQAAAEAALARAAAIALSERDSARVAEALLHPRPPTPALRALIREHAARVEQR